MLILRTFRRLMYHVSKTNVSMFAFLKSVHITVIQNDLLGSQPVMDAKTFQEEIVNHTLQAINETKHTLPGQVIFSQGNDVSIRIWKFH